MQVPSVITAKAAVGRLYGIQSNLPEAFAAGKLNVFPFFKSILGIFLSLEYLRLLHSPGIHSSLNSMNLWQVEETNNKKYK